MSELNVNDVLERINVDGNLTLSELKKLKTLDNEENSEIIKSELESKFGLTSLMNELMYAKNKNEVAEMLGGDWHSEKVVMVQLYLKLSGCEVGKIDGYVGDKLSLALKDYGLKIKDQQYILLSNKIYGLNDKISKIRGEKEKYVDKYREIEKTLDTLKKIKDEQSEEYKEAKLQLEQKISELEKELDEIKEDLSETLTERDDQKARAETAEQERNEQKLRAERAEQKVSEMEIKLAEMERKFSFDSNISNVEKSLKDFKLTFNDIGAKKVKGGYEVADSNIDNSKFTKWMNSDFGVFTINFGFNYQQRKGDKIIMSFDDFLNDEKSNYFELSWEEIKEIFDDKWNIKKDAYVNILKEKIKKII